jgi:hypothetical protein
MAGERKIRENRRGLADFSPAPLIFKKYTQKLGASEKRDGNCHVFANSRWATLPCRYLLMASFSGFFITPSQREQCPS